MRRLINRLLVWLGLREPPPTYDPTLLELYKPSALLDALLKSDKEDT